MDLSHVQCIGLLNYCPCLRLDAAAQATCKVVPVRDAREGAPLLLASRQVRKQNTKSNKFQIGSHEECIPQVVEATSQAWLKEITQGRFEERSGAQAALMSGAEWYQCCKQHLATLSRNLGSVQGFQAAVAQMDVEALAEIVAGFLDRKLVRQAHESWKEGVRRGGVVPFWKDEEGSGYLQEHNGLFDCIILEPFNPDYDPTFVLKHDGMLSIGAAVSRLVQRLSALDACRDCTPALLSELEQLTLEQQVLLREVQASVLQTVRAALAGILKRLDLELHSLFPFGSLELGTATATSDIDLAVFVHTTLNPYSLVHFCKESLESNNPLWIKPGTLEEVLQTFKIPVLRFEFVLERELSMPGVCRLKQVLNDLGICTEVPEMLSGVMVDISFNNNLAQLETKFQQDSFQVGSVYQFLLWLKYWTKAEGINDAKDGKLSSFAWRMIGLTYLIECGVAPCLRNGFEGVDNPPLSGGFNVWYSQRSAQPEQVGMLPLIQGFANELLACVGSDSVRVFQVVTERTHLLDDIVAQMKLEGQRLRQDIVDAVQQLPRDVRLVFCDVDGVLIRITSEMLAAELEGASDFFFNTSRSVPDHASQHIVSFLHELELQGYSIAIISGRDDGVLPHIKILLEQPRLGPRLSPFVYVFKSAGSHAPTVDHKSEASRQILECCRGLGKNVQALVILDDMEPHMAAFLSGASNFHVPTSALMAYPGPANDIRLRRHNPLEKHIVVLALTHGSGKFQVMTEICNRLPTARLVLWDSAGMEYWNTFVGNVLDAMREPGIQFVLVKMVPDLAKVRKLALFLGEGGSVCCFHPTLDFFNGNDAAPFHVAQFQAVLQSNAMRQQVGGLSVHVAVPEELGLWPPQDKQSYRQWATSVWAGEHGINRAFVRVKGKSQRCRNMIKEANHSWLRLFPMHFHKGEFPLHQAHLQEAQDALALLAEKLAAERRRADVEHLMGRLQHGVGVVDVALRRRRCAAHVADDICAELRRISAHTSSLPEAAALGEQLEQFID